MDDYQDQNKEIKSIYQSGTLSEAFWPYFTKQIKPASEKERIHNYLLTELESRWSFPEIIKPDKNRQTIKGKLVVLTDVMGGNGDYYVTTNIIRFLQQHTQLDIVWIVRDKNGKPVPDDITIPCESITEWRELTDDQKLKSSLEEADCLLVCPTIDGFGKDGLNKLKRFGKKILYIPEYSAVDETFSSLSEVDITDMDMAVLPLGFGRSEAGVLIDPLRDEDITQLEDIECLSHAGLEFDRFFLGYFSSDADSSKTVNAVNPQTFIRSCLPFCREADDNVLIVVNHDWEPNEKDGQAMLGAGFGRARIVQRDGTEQTVSYDSNNQRLLTVYHPAQHIPHEQFISLIYHAEPLIGCTGDRSWSEVLSRAASGRPTIPFHQVMKWKALSFKYFVEILADMAIQDMTFAEIIAHSKFPALISLMNWLCPFQQLPLVSTASKCSFWDRYDEPTLPDEIFAKLLKTLGPEDFHKHINVICQQVEMTSKQLLSSHNAYDNLLSWIAVQLPNQSDQALSHPMQL